MFGLIEPLNWKRSDPQPHSITAPRLTVKVHRQRPAEAVLLVILYWIHSPGKAAYSFLLFCGPARESRIFTPEYIFSSTKTVSRLWGAEVEGLRKPPSTFFSCTQLLWKLTNADRQMPRVSVHGGRSTNYELAAVSVLLHAPYSESPQLIPLFSAKKPLPAFPPFSVQDKLCFYVLFWVKKKKILMREDKMCREKKWKGVILFLNIYSKETIPLIETLWHISTYHCCSGLCFACKLWIHNCNPLVCCCCCCCQP